MGKTAQGAVWLNADQFSPYDFWQYWRNVEDADVVKFLKLFTILPMSEIDKARGAARAARSTKPRRCWRRRRPRCCTAATPPTQPPKPRGRRLRKARSRRACRRWKFRAANSKPAPACWRLFVKAGLVASNGEARRQIKGGGLRVNDAAVTDEKMVLTPSNLTPEGVIKLSHGQEKHVLLKPA